MSFSDQSPVAAQLQRSLERGRLAHAYLFSGPRGAGKEDVARMLAKALNCELHEADCCRVGGSAGALSGVKPGGHSRPTSEPCDACRRIEAGNHPDIYWVRPESKSRRITVEQIREFEKSVNLKASMARIKVGIIVDADCMSEEASNAFLKTLEEPPAQTIIILLTAQPQRLLTTILSRCLKISFGAVARADSPYRARVLAMLTKFTSRSLAGVYQLHAAVTGLLQTLKAEIRERVEADHNLDRYAELDPKLRAQLEDQNEARIEGEYRAAREQVLEELYSWFGDVWLCVEQAEAGLLEHPEELAALQQAAADLSPMRAAANLDAVEQIREALTRNINETLALEVGLLKLMRPA